MSKQFAEFRVGELLTHEIDRGDISSQDDFQTTVSNGTVLVAQNKTRNGFVRETDYKGRKIFPKDSIVVGRQTGVVYYQPYEFATTDGVLVLLEGLTLRKSLYLVTALKKSLFGSGYSNTVSAESLLSITVNLPVTDASANTDTPEPDWEYMENYIKIIEQKFIDQVAGINTREQEILAQLHPDAVNTEPEAHGFEEVRVGDLFKITPTSYYKSTPPFASDLTPQVTNTTQPNGISSFEPHAPNNEKNVITFSDTTVGGDTLFYQPVDFLGYSHIQKMTPTETALTKRKATYIITAFKKAVNGRYDYGTKFNRDNAAQTFIQLPVTSTGDIDWDYMGKYIAWIETQERE